MNKKAFFVISLLIINIVAVATISGVYQLGNIQTVQAAAAATVSSASTTATDTTIVSGTACNTANEDGTTEGTNVDTIVTLSTDFEAGDNLVIAVMEIMSSDAGNELIVEGNLDLRSGTASSETELTSNDFDIAIGNTNGKSEQHVLLYKHTSASANQQYTITACGNATVIQATATIVAIQGIQNSAFSDGTITAFSNTETTLTSLGTSLPAGDNIILAMVHAENQGSGAATTIGGDGSCTQGCVKVKNGSTVLASNQFSVILGTGNPASRYAWFIVARESGASASPTYTCTIQGSADQTSDTANCDLLVFQGSSHVYVDSGSTAIGVTPTSLGTVDSTFQVGSEVVVFAGMEADDTNTVIEFFSAGDIELRREGTMMDESNLLLQAKTEGGSGNVDNTMYPFAFRIGSDREEAAATYEVTADASATGLNGAIQLVAVKIDSYSDTANAGIAYRSNTGTCTTNDLNCVKYREWNPSTQTWSAETELATSGSPIRFAQLKWFDSKRVIVTLSDDGTLDSFVCTSSCTSAGSWTAGNDFEDLWSSAPTDDARPYDIEFENATGDLIIVYDHGTSSTTDDIGVRVMTQASTSFGSETAVDDTSAGADLTYDYIKLARQFGTGSEKIGVIAHDETNQDTVLWVWSGSAMGDFLELTAAACGGCTDGEMIAIAAERSSGNLWALSSHTIGASTNDVIWAEYTTSWGSPDTTGCADGCVQAIAFYMRAHSDTNSASDKIAVAVQDSLSNDVHLIYWSGSAMTITTDVILSSDSVTTRDVDFVWETGSSGRGIVVAGEAAAVVSYKLFTAPSTFTALRTMPADSTHPWIHCSEQNNPTTADVVSGLCVALTDTTFDLRAMKWRSYPADLQSADTGAPTTDQNGAAITMDTTVTTYEAFSISFQQATVPAAAPPSIAQNTGCCIFSINPFVIVEKKYKEFYLTIE